MFKISIITINYNNLRGLERTIKSVKEQTWKNFEYIIIDGGSSDGSKELLHSMSNEISLWVSEPDNGIYHAMNKGIKASNGEYLIFLNSGDELLDPGVLKKNIIEINTQDIIYFDQLMIYPDNKRIWELPSTLDYNFFILGSLPHPSTFIKKELFEKVGYYDENLKIVSDWKFFMTAILNYKCSSKKVDQVLTKFYKDGISTNCPDLLNIERNIVLQEEFLSFKRLYDLELIIKKFKKSKSIKILHKLGFLKYLD